MDGAANTHPPGEGGAAKDAGNVVLNEYRCCVCLEVKTPVPSCMYTACSNHHSVCVECVFEIVKKDGDVVTRIPCPLCREETERLAPYGAKSVRVLRALTESGAVRSVPVPPDSDCALFADLVRISLMTHNVLDIAFFCRLDDETKGLYRQYAELVRAIKVEKETLDRHWKSYQEVKETVNSLKRQLRQITDLMQSLDSTNSGSSGIGIGRSASSGNRTSRERSR